MMQVGRIPVAADSFDAAGLRFEVVDMDGKRVDKVLVQPLPSSANENTDPNVASFLTADDRRVARRSVLQRCARPRVRGPGDVSRGLNVTATGAGSSGAYRSTPSARGSTVRSTRC
jgi:hypothetical protein